MSVSILFACGLSFTKYFSAKVLQMNNKPVSFNVIDIQTKQVVANCKTRNGANRSADSRDRSYGAVRYIVQAVYS